MHRRCFLLRSLHKEPERPSTLGGSFSKGKRQGHRGRIPMMQTGGLLTFLMIGVSRDHTEKRNRQAAREVICQPVWDGTGKDSDYLRRVMTLRSCSNLTVSTRTATSGSTECNWACALMDISHLPMT